jgi:hypothetical protein
MKTTSPTGYFVIVFLLFASVSTAQVIDLNFASNYLLIGNGANQIGPRTPIVGSRFDLVDWPMEAPLLMGQQATECLEHLLPEGGLPAPPYTVETWSLYHVNQAVGMSVLVGNPAQPDWLSGHYGRFQLLHTEGITDTTRTYRGWKRYWLHQATVVTADSVHFYQDGAPKLSRAVNHSEGAELNLCFYLKTEPYMEAANLLKRLRIYDAALSNDELVAARANLETDVETGKRYPDLFHFNAGPYLHGLRPDGVNITWETDQLLRSARVFMGESLPLTSAKTHSLRGEADGATDPIQIFRAEGLRPATAYFYEVEVVDEQGDTIHSGPLTFKTAPAMPAPFTFAVLGDTEARPHVNNRLGQLIWDERPAFLLNLGDLTDGGKEPHKFEWNLEYFTGLDALTSRVPAYTVPGNGEGDLYWYKRYHNYPELGDAYSFVYGDVEFFMLNSNQRAEFAPGGRQYEWLAKKLAASTARYKIVAHHHAPYSSDENDYGNSWEGPSALGDTLVRKIVPLYEQYGVDLVFFGHLHTYERSLPIKDGMINRRGGVVYVQGGGGGGNLENFAPTRSWFSGKTYRGHHYFTVSVDEERIHLRMYDSEGRMRDFFEVAAKVR